MTYPEIAKHLGYADHSGARDLVKKGLEELTREPAEELRDLELSRLDDVIRGLYPKVMRGDHNASNSVMRAVDLRSRLNGLFDVQVDNGQADAVKILGDFLAKTIESAGDGIDESD
ncbi:hypothetical protein [Corynebacterium sp. A21]|uniref:hypothetical protein n=1 Tax=Corynebacterium sp. A21 TaxID=3457318 RepID=UPI003FD01AA5